MATQTEKNGSKKGAFSGVDFNTEPLAPLAIAWANKKHPTKVSVGQAMPSGRRYAIDRDGQNYRWFCTSNGASSMCGYESVTEAQAGAEAIEQEQLGANAPKQGSLEDQLAAQLPGFVSKGQAAQKAVDAAVATAAITSAPFPTSKGSELVDLELLEEHPSNPRKLFRKLEELAQQIQATGGLLIPIIARPHPTRLNTYQIVAGARRYRALQLLKKKKSPIAEKVLVDIRELTDAQVAEAFLTENDREDLQPLEEADGYKGMLASGHTPASIASTLGVGLGTVHARLKLLELSPKARGLMEAGTITSAVATPLARLPHEMQDEALERMLDDRHRQGMGGDNLWHRGEWENRHDSKEAKKVHVRTAIEWLQEHFTKSLKTTAFDQEDATYEVGHDVAPAGGTGLLGTAPACSACPKNSNNMHPDVAGENPHGRSSAGFCTLPPCYDEKWKLALAKLRTDAREQGDVKVLNEAQSRKALERKDRWGYELRETRFAKLSEVNHADPKKRTYGQLLELANAELDDGEKVQKVLAVADTGKAHLVDKQELEKVLAAMPATKAWAKPKKASASGGFDIDAYQRRRELEEAKAEARQRVGLDVLKQYAEQQRKVGLLAPMVSAMLEVSDEQYSEDLEAEFFTLAGRREREAYLAKKATLNELLVLVYIRTIAIEIDNTYSGYPDEIERIAKLQKIDLKAREKALAATSKEDAGE